MSAREQNCTKPLKKIVSFWDVFSYPKGVLFACLFFSGGGGIYSKKKTFQSGLVETRKIPDFRWTSGLHIRTVFLKTIGLQWGKASSTKNHRRHKIQIPLYCNWDNSMFVFANLLVCFRLIQFKPTVMSAILFNFEKILGRPFCTKWQLLHPIALFTRYYRLRVDLVGMGRAMCCSLSATQIFQLICRAATYRNAAMLRKPNWSWREQVFAVCRRANSQAWPFAQSTDTHWEDSGEHQSHANILVIPGRL